MQLYEFKISLQLYLIPEMSQGQFQVSQAAQGPAKEKGPTWLR